MSRWDGFASMSYGGPGGGDRIMVAADFWGDFASPTPLAILSQVFRDPLGSVISIESVDLTEPELRWLVEVAGPRALARMRERP